MPDEAQSQGDQGQGQQDGGLYDLSSIPEDLRPAVEPVFKQFDANVTREFQKRAEALNAWKPYEELGVNQIPTEELQQLLQFRELASDEGQFKDWVRQAAESLGVLDQQGPDDEFGYGDEPQGLTEERVKEMLQEALQQDVGPIKQHFEAQEREKAITEHQTKIGERIDELAQKHKIELGDKQRQAVFRLALSYGEDPQGIDKGFADYQELVGGAERGVFQQKLGQPSPAEAGGRPASSPERITTFEDAKRAFKEDLARGRSMTP